MGEDYPGGVVIANTARLSGIHLLDRAERVVYLPGTTLYAPERCLALHGREQHSVIGSSCIVAGGVCNNSGGSFVRRGGAYTEYALFAPLTRLERWN